MFESSRSAKLTREASSDDGTFGTYVSDRGFTCRTVELPWRDNAPNISCVPPGRYPCRRRWSEKHGKNLYHVDDVPGRDADEIHSANVAGDVAKGYGSQLLGCIAPGADVAVFPENSIHQDEHMPPRDQRGVTSSSTTLASLEADMRDEDGAPTDFWLEIV